MRLKNPDLFAAILIVALNIVWTQVPYHPLIIGIVLALPLVLILPGYMITQTLLRKRSSTPEPSNSLLLRPSLILGQPINAADHIILSLGLSMAIDVIVGFALNILPIGLQGSSWILSLGLITIVFALLVAFLRRKDAVKVAGISRPSMPISTSILFGSSILIAAIAIWLSMIRPPDPQPSFTQFWMLPAKNNSCELLLGIQSFEASPVTYRVVMTNNGVPVTTWTSVVLAPQQTWHQTVSIKGGAAHNIYIEAQLYRTDQPGTVYREVHITLNSTAGSKNQKMHC